MKDDLKRNTFYQKFISFFVLLAQKFPLPLKLKKFVKYDIFSYIFIGGTTTLVDAVVYFVLFSLMMQMGYSKENCVDISNLFAFIVAILYAFFPNKLAVFESFDYHLKTITKEFVSFTLSRLMSFALQLLLMHITVAMLDFPNVLMKILVGVVVLIINYVFGKFFVFNKNPFGEKDKENLKNE